MAGPRMGRGSGEINSLKGWLGQRTQDPYTQLHPVDQQRPQIFLVGTLRDPHVGWGKGPTLVTPTFHSPSFLTLRMTPLRISAGKGGEGSGC